MHTGRKMLDNDVLSFSPEHSPSKEFKSGDYSPKKDRVLIHNEGGKPEMMITDHSINDVMDMPKI